MVAAMDDRPVIALTSRTLPLRATGKSRPTETVARSYIEAVEAAGGEVWLLPNRDDLDRVPTLLDRVDGIMLTGGDDPHPHLFGEEPLVGIDLVDERRDRFEIALVNAAREGGTAVFGVCRGMQLMNVALGGDIYQDIARQTDSRIQHTQSRVDDGPWHRVGIAAGSRLEALVGSGPIAVNSFHHQACRRVAAGLVASAICVEDGLIEAIEDPEAAFFLGVQWHPELTADLASRALFQAFIEAARSGAAASSN